MFERIPFAGNAIDRLDGLRDDPAALGALRDDPGSLFLPFRDLKAWIRVGRTPRLGWLPRTRLTQTDGEPLLLGRLQGAARFAVALDAPPGDDGGKFIDARSIAADLSPAESGLLAQARSLLAWHAAHRFCAACGVRTRAARGGMQRDCPACEARHYPRNDPVVIMLVTRGDACLLGRQHRYVEDFWSCLAGFVEPGETLEGAVRREVLEEAGVEVGAVRYVGSQPWPFPASLMLGCHAEATSETLAIDRRELVEARWFPRDEVAAMLANCEAEAGPRLPRGYAIAHHLVRHWLEATAGS
ncbi:MAG: NAD(+) diphosphatase [Gammaproteobacteria bacterium]|nr:NAD(+) diphosphatase [Gammaproteobacteria bacterium]